MIEKLKIGGRGKYGAILAQKNKADADAFAQSVRPALLKAMSRGSRRPTAVARRLNDAGVPSASGGRWHAQTVKRVLDRLGPEFADEVLTVRRANISDEERQAHAEILRLIGKG